MKSAPFLITTAFTCLLTAGASAQTTVYETRDAEGNASFSDESSPGSDAVEIQPTDVMEAPKPMPEEVEDGEASKLAAEAPQLSEEERTTRIYEDGYDENADDPRLRRREDVDVVNDATKAGEGPAEHAAPHVAPHAGRHR